MFTAAMFIFFCKIPKRVRRASPLRLGFHGSEPARLSSWLGIVNAVRIGSMRSEIFFKMKLITFQGCPTKQAVFLHGQPAPYN